MQLLPLALLTFLPSSLASLPQTPLLTVPPIAKSTTLIDALSADHNYTRLLLLLQRSRLVPTLNRLNGSTLFAPTNDAISTHTLFTAASAASDDAWTSLADNVQDKLRQQLLYHLLNYSMTELPSVQPNPAQGQTQVLKTLLFPREGKEPQREPWVPVPGGSLGGEPQRLRWAVREGKGWVGTDYKGDGGVEIVRRPVKTGNGVLWGIGGILDPPLDLAHVVSQQSELSYFHKILPSSLKDMLNSSSELTLFMPQNSAWDGLHEVEKLYLESKFADDDVRKILDMHSVLNHGVQWSDTFSDNKELTTVYGNKLTLHVSPNVTNVSSAVLVQPDHYASNGVLHVVDSLLNPPGALQLTPEKYLLALNCTTFVSLLRSVQLSSLVNTTNASYTILAPGDDVISLLGDDVLPDPGSDELERLLRYHFLPGEWTEEKLRDGMLLETALEETGLNGGKQVLAITVAGTGSNRELTFGGAAVIGGKPVIVNDTIIYLITRALIPPTDALETALPSLQFSMFLAAVFSSSLANKLKTFPTTTLLIPQNAAFERLGLVTTHLLLPASKPDLEKMIEHHAVTEVAYLDALQNGSRKSYPTLEGSDIHVERSENGSVYISPSGGWYGLRGSLGFGNVLTQTGVIHEVTGVLLPRSMDISVGKLAIAAKGSTMVSLAVKAGLEWILNGTAPPSDSEWGRAGMTGSGWTLLCPTDSSFKEINMTQLWNDEAAMRRLVSQHLIPGPASMAQVTTSSEMARTLAKSADPNRPIYFDGKATYSTLLSHTSQSVYGDIVFRQGEMGYLVGIRDARGTDGEDDWANVLGWGRSTTGGADVGGVVQIDNLLVPYQPAWWIAYGPPAAVAVGGLLLMGGFFWVIARVWRRETGEATYEPVGGFDREDDE